MPFLELISVKYLHFNVLRPKFVKSLLKFPFQVNLGHAKAPGNLTLKNACVYGRDEETLELIHFDLLELITDTETEFHIVVGLPIFLHTHTYRVLSTLTRQIF